MALTQVGTNMISSGGGSIATNTALGNSALNSNTTGSFNDAFGSNAAASNTTGTNLSAFGAYTLNKNTTGIVNSAFGGSNTIPALYNNTTGSYNCAFGTGALFSNTTASNNTSVGYQAGYSNTTGFGNVLMGNFAGYSSVTANYQTAFGYGSLQTATGGSNTGLGVFALNAVTTGTNNTGVGPSAGSALTSGSKNTIIGGYSGNQGGLDIRTASNYIVLSDGDGNPRQIIDSSGTLLMGCTGGGSTTGGARFYTDTQGDSMKIFNVQGSSANYTLLSAFSNASTPSNPTGTIRFNLVTNGGIQNYSANNVNLSDIREKTDIELADGYLSKICAIPVKTFNYIDQNMDDDQGKTLGVIAQDVQEVAPELVKESNWGTKEEPKMRLSIYQTDLQYALMKCIQELKAEVDSLKAQLEAK